MVPRPFDLLTDLPCYFIAIPLNTSSSLDKQFDDIIMPCKTSDVITKALSRGVVNSILKGHGWGQMNGGVVMRVWPGMYLWTRAWWRGVWPNLSLA